MQKAANEILREVIRAVEDLPKGIYAPSDDTSLMLDTITKMQVEGKKVLDIGTGSGILGIFCAARGARVTVTDIDDSALHHAQKAARAMGLSIQAIMSDIFSNVQGRSDLIIFNPPYLPSSRVEDRTVDGGTQGTVLSKRFLADLADHLERDGTALLLVSSLNDSASLLSAAIPQFDHVVMGKRSLFFEELKVLRIRFREDLAG